MCVHGAASLRTIFLLFFFDQSTTRNTRDGRSSTNQQSTADCDITGTSATRDTRSKLVRKVLHLPISATTVSPVITSNQPAFLTPSPNELDLRARLTGSSLTFYPKKPREANILAISALAGQLRTHAGTKIGEERSKVRESSQP